MAYPSFLYVGSHMTQAGVLTLKSLGSKKDWLVKSRRGHLIGVASSIQVGLTIYGILFLPGQEGEKAKPDGLEAPKCPL